MASLAGARPWRDSLASEGGPRRRDTATAPGAPYAALGRAAAAGRCWGPQPCRSVAGSRLPAVEAVPGERLHQLGLLVGQMGEQDVAQDVGRFLQPVEAFRAAQVLDQRGVHVLKHLV